MSLAALVRARRRYLGMTQRDLAVMVPVDRSYVSKLEAGRVAPGVDTLRRLAVVLDVPLAELVRAAERCPTCDGTGRTPRKNRVP